MEIAGKERRKDTANTTKRGLDAMLDAIIGATLATEAKLAGAGQKGGKDGNQAHMASVPALRAQVGTAPRTVAPALPAVPLALLESSIHESG